MADSNTSLAPRSTREPTSTPPATAGDHHAPRPAEPNDPSTAPNRPTTPARTDAGFPQHRPHPFHSTPLKPSPNPWLIDRETGKARRISLVDDTGMGTRFHQLGLNTFNNIIPGGLPSEEDRRKFTTPDLGEKNMSEHDIGIQLNNTIKSIIRAAGADHKLAALLTPYHKARGDHGNPSDTVNDLGVYLTTEAAQRATHLLRKDITRSKYTKNHLEENSFGRRSWYWMAILGEVKSETNRTCAFSMIPRSLPSPEVATAPGVASNNVLSVSMSPSQVPSPSVGVQNDAIPATTQSTSTAPPEVEAAEPYISKDPRGEEGLGQVAEYMHNLLTHQHRLFAYGYYVKWKYARLLYFDRAGAVISEPFDWTHSASLLHDFIWKAAHMSLEQLGYDPTVEVASEPEIDLLRSKMGDELKVLPVEVQQYVLDAFLSTATRQPEARAEDAEDSTTKPKKKAKAKSEVPLDEIPIYKLTVTSSDPPTDEVFPEYEPPTASSAPSSAPPPASGTSASGERKFLVGRPHFAAGSLIGRCTRGYIALDLKTETFCFLKDSWRPLVPGRSRPEHLVYERLRNRQVPRIASLICGGDVGGPRAQKTTVQDHIPLEKRPVPRVHYRIVIEEIGLPLTEFKTFTELAGLFGHALLAHMTAHHWTGILHRDISIGNILINPVNRTGILIDWDLSRLISELGDGPMEPDRTGTWQFRSALSLYYPRKPYRASDDIESFVHSWRYMVLRFHPTGIKGLRDHVQGYFEHSTKVGSFRLGGQHKMGDFDKERSSFRVKNNPKLQNLLDEIAKRCFDDFYKLFDRDLMERKYGIPTDEPEPVPERAPQPSLLSNADDLAILDLFRDHATAPPPEPSTPPPSYKNVDACDITHGFLCHQYDLITLFREFQSDLLDKHEDQFILRAGEEPAKPVSNAPAQGIFRMSTTSTRDSTEDPSGSGHVASVTAPSTAATSPPVSPPALESPPPLSSPALNSPMASLSFDEPSTSRLPPPTDAQSRRKRRQKKDGQADTAAIADSNDGSSVELSPSKQEPKRSKKGRS